MVNILTREMPEQKTKHTHTVQKEYLKNFSQEENGKFLLWRLDKKTRNIIRLSIDNVSVENYFYPQDIEDWLDTLAKILEKDDTIRFAISYDHPLRVEMDFNKLGNTSLEYFLAPRALKDDDREDDENMDDF